MEDYKKRVADEYRELGIRMIKLQNMLIKNSKGELGFELTCPIDLLERQLEVMREYMKILEERAGIEGIVLSLDFKEGE